MSERRQATLTITITGERWSDLQFALEAVLSHIEDENVLGKNSNDTGSYYFDIKDHHLLDQENDDECECSEYYRHRGEHTPGCPADDGERGPLDA